MLPRDTFRKNSSICIDFRLKLACFPLNAATEATEATEETEETEESNEAKGDIEDPKQGEDAASFLQGIEDA